MIASSGIPDDELEAPEPGDIPTQTVPPPPPAPPKPSRRERMGDRRVRPTWLVLLVLAANGSAAASVAVTWAGKPSLVLTWSTLALVVAVTLVAVSVVLSLWSRLR